MKIFKNIILIVSLMILLPNDISAKNEVNLYLFHSSTCSHCAKEKEFLKELEEKYDNLNIRMYEVTENKENDKLLTDVKKALRSDSPYVPYTVIGTRSYVGYNENIANLIEETIIEYTNKEYRDIVGEIIGIVPKKSNPIVIDEQDKNSNKMTVPILGEIDVKTVSIPLLAIIIGAVDGFNPCAMWVLLFLISMLLGMKNKKRMWTLGIAFLVTSALIYLLFMMAWLNISMKISSIIWVRILIAIVALIGGAINLKNYFKKTDSGCDVVDKNKRQKMFDQIKKFTSEKSFILALLGVIALAISVNFVELACSAGLPLIFTQILAFNDLSFIQSFSYTLLYILFFLIDDIIIFSIAMISLQLTGISTKYSKYSHLVGGIIMILIGVLMVIKPEWLMFNFN